MPPRVVIVGGGLGGLAAAARLTDRGFHTTLIERRKLLGGRSTSIPDAESGQLLDNCQHVLLGCCTELLRLYERLGQTGAIEFFDTIHFADQAGRRGDLYATPLPSPLHLGWSMLRFPLLTMGQKIEIARAMLAMKLMGRAGRDDAVDQTFGQWLGRHGQSPSTIERYWNVVIVSALNEPVETVGAHHAIQVFQESFLGSRGGYRMGVSRVPLSNLYVNAVATTILTGAKVESIAYDTARHRVTGVRLLSGEILPADAVIVATAPDAAARLLSPIAPLAPLVATLDAIEQAPIIGAHFFYDRPAMDPPHLALVGTTLQWLFRKDAEGRHLHGVISAAQALVGLDNGALTRRFDAEIRRILPAARHAKLLRSVIVKEKRATFRPLPGLERRRPAQRTAVPNLLLAGDYTQTDWPSTMEGAVRGGNRAADAVAGCGL